MARSLTLPAFFLVIQLISIPLILHELPPMVDMPNHMARLTIAVSDGGPLSEYYSYVLRPVPNLALDLMWRFAHSWMSIERFVQLTTLCYVVHFVFSVLLLSRVLHGHWSPWPLAAGLLVFNACFFWGFQNYLFAIPFAIDLFALWLFMESSSPLRRALAFVPLALALYFMHFFAFSAFAILVMGRELQRLLAAANKAAHLLHQIVAVGPFLAPLAFLLLVTQLGPPPFVAPRTEYSEPLGQIVIMLVSPFWGHSAAELPLLQILMYVSFLVFVIAFSPLILSRSRVLTLAPKMYGPLLALFLVAIVAPNWLNGVALVHVRFPFVVLALLIASTSWRGLRRSSATILALAILTLLVARTASVLVLSERQTAEVAQLRQVLSGLPEGARVLPTSNYSDLEGVFQLRRAHMQAFAVIDRSAMIPTLFQGVHALSVKPRWREITHPATGNLDHRVIFELDPLVTEKYVNEAAKTSHYQYWVNWRKNFTHVLSFRLSEDFPVSQWGLKEQERDGVFALYCIEHDGDRVRVCP